MSNVVGMDGRQAQVPQKPLHVADHVKQLIMHGPMIACSEVIIEASETLETPDSMKERKDVLVAMGPDVAEKRPDLKLGHFVYLAPGSYGAEVLVGPEDNPETIRLFNAEMVMLSVDPEDYVQ